MTIQVVKRWGNSLAVRIPANLAQQVHLAEDQEVDVEVQDGTIVVRARRPVPLFSREKLIEQYRSSKLKRHDEIDFGDPVGTEWGGPDDPTR
ncbi:antitoxin MazE [Paraburkholderia unamae]|uniref:AbrB/MazE/SpoVT family DNA-binding domain-containing protein n=1 Tax=Paraburkholderia unamae TaxID=219649 RepID=UPI000DC2055E|nr:AbrB/MazE/SpoVT family DNA-binding domain-containing protein [Paraburkholderia unamae]RAR53879.1 antitoxin MazE [Paraburkholderia unamae]